MIVLLILAISSLFSKTYKGAEYRTKVSYTYGRFEVRVRSAQASGMLSSFFTYYDGGGGSSAWNEVDIEIMGRYSDEAQFNAITPGSPYQINHVNRDTLEFNPHVDFHVYAFEWTPDYVAWFVDSVETCRQTGDHVQTLTRAQKIMMNIWPSSDAGWAGTLNPAALPLYAYYDWVKYYAYTPGVNHNYTLQWTADFDSWDQTAWAKATHTWDGNNCDFIYDNAVFQDGYLILCLTNSVNTGYSGEPVVDTDIVPPYAVWARKTAGQVDISFSEKLNITQAEKTSNYIMTGVSIQKAVLHPDGRTVTLTTSPLDPEKSYNLILTGITDLAGNKMPLSHIVPSAYLALPLKINAGGESITGYLGDQTYDYSKEYGVTGGSPLQISGTTEISGTDDDAVYRATQEGLTFYQVRVPNGHYSVSLMLAENEMGAAGQRVFNIKAEGAAVLNNVDVFAAVGKNSAYQLTIPDVEVNDGVLDLYFEPVVGKALLNGLQIESISSAIPDRSQIPTDFNLNLYPNPFNATASIRYQLPKPAQVLLEVFDLTGRLVGKLVNQRQSAGVHLVQFNGEGMSSGLYFCRMLVDGNLADVKKAVLVK